MAEGRKKTDGAVFKGGYLSGEDASYIEPKLIPDYELLPRDDSGGPEWDPYTAEFADGGYVTGDKSHLSARGGKDDDASEGGDEQSQAYRKGGAEAVAGGKKTVKDKQAVPASSKKLEKE
jgi:hypothetical protein